MEGSRRAGPAAAGSNRLRLRPLTLADEVLVDGIFDQLTAYSMLAEGVPKAANAARQFLTELPPGCDPQAKHVFAVMKGAEAVGLVDLVSGYPEPGIAFLGLHAVVESRQRQGIGRSAERMVERLARGLGASRLRLVVLEDNKVARTFWKRAGFRETGERKIYSGVARTAAILVMEKPLACA